MGLERFWRIKACESTVIKISLTDPHGSAKAFQAGSIFGVALLDQSQAITQHLTGVLVTAAADELLHD